MIKYVLINGVEHLITNPEQATIEAVHRAAAGQDASLANAIPYLDGETVKFRYNVGTKGAVLRFAKWGGTTFSLEGANAQDPVAIQREIAKQDASIANASYRVEGDTVEFFYQVGTKG